MAEPQDGGVLAAGGERIKARLAVLSIWVNVALTIGKWVVGTLAASDALLADAAHSGADVAGSLAVMIGVSVARRPADRDHPYGHGKAEVIAASLVAVVLVLAGLDVMYSSLRALFRPLASPQPAALFAAAAAAAVKEWMYRYQLRVGRTIHSPALIAGASDHRSDVYASLAAMGGIGLAMIGWAAHVRALLYADPVAGLIVAAVVVWIGYLLARESFANLMDQVADADTTAALAARVKAVPGVLSLDDVRVRAAGPYWMADVKIGVAPHISVRAGHDIANLVREAVMADFPQARDVFVHVNPFGDSD